MKKEIWTIQRLLKWITGYFSERDIDSPRLAGEILLAHCLNYSRIDLYTRHEQPLNEDELARFKELVKKRIQREPIAYIIGKREFWSLGLAVTRDVLIPRPETECLVEAALEVMGQNFTDKRVLDLGTGSGAIILALAKEKPGNFFIATDLSPKALDVARANAKTHELKIEFINGSWFDAVHCLPRFDLIVSNPPYIRTSDLKTLEPEIARYEPVAALDGGPLGMDALINIISRAPEHLTAGGWLILEMGFDQKQLVKKAIDETDAYHNMNFINDLAGLNRVVQMQFTG